jgi:hypothetical protein
MVFMELYTFRNSFGFSGKLEPWFVHVHQKKMCHLGRTIKNLMRPNIAGQWLVFLLRIQESPHSNLGLKMAILTLMLSVFLLNLSRQVP